MDLCATYRMPDLLTGYRGVGPQPEDLAGHIPGKIARLFSPFRFVPRVPISLIFSFRLLWLAGIKLGFWQAYVLGSLLFLASYGVLRLIVNS